MGGGLQIRRAHHGPKMTGLVRSLTGGRFFRHGRLISPNTMPPPAPR
jgi:hypothetical protein